MQYVKFSLQHTVNQSSGISEPVKFISGLELYFVYIRLMTADFKGVV